MAESNPAQKAPDEIDETSAQKSEPEETDGACPIAGFGASAGGLEAITDVLHHLPADSGLAIVFVQHLDPKHTSVLADLLSHSTRMPVVHAKDGMRVEPNRVHVIPPNTNISISQGVLKVEPRPAGLPHMPIDHFFRSLAADQGAKAAAIVLSGTASDGTLGLKAVKAEGGITFAQEPDSAKYEGMPRSAIAAGCVDLILPPGEIAAELVRLCRHPYLRRQSPAETPTKAEGDFGEIFKMLRSAKGVDFSQYKPGTVRRRTLRRIALKKLESPGQYVQYLKEHRDELDALFQDLLINVTAFFREPETFTAIRSHLLPSLLHGRPRDSTLRIWVPGCSTGEEVYSVAICVLDYLWDARLDIPVQVFGTDLSEEALQTARAGVYPESIAADVSNEQLRRFFSRAEGGYQISRSVRDVCVFARQNVTNDPPFSRLDLITCRNVLIYLGPVLQSKVMRLFHYALKPGGYLVLGNSEHTGKDGETYFQVVDKRRRIYARKSAAANITADFESYDRSERESAPRSTSEMDAQAKVDRLLLARYSPAAVVVDERLNVQQFRGDTSQYLGFPGREATLEFPKLARGGLGPEVRRLVDSAITTGLTARSESIPIAVEGTVRRVTASVVPVPGLSEPQFLVVLEPVHIPETEFRETPRREDESDNDRIRELEQELVSTREYLQSVIEEQEVSTEELKSAHEEVQSSNEELQSTNEELLTAKEELQSTNEELTTVNEEMQNRNVELQQINNDLINLLSSVNIPIMMLGNDLRIRRFTPQAERILNLLPTDVGRPISDFRLKINVPDLVALCQEVVDTLASKEREVQDADARVYSMWIRPYRTSDNRIDGVVIALVDVTERKKAVEARYRRLFEAAKDAIVIADAETGEIADVNPFTTNLFGYARAKLIGGKYWDSPLFEHTEIDQSLLAELRDHEAVQKSLSLPSESGERIAVDIVASLYTEGERKVVQFNIRDISARKRIEERLQRGEEQARQAQKMEAVGRLAGGVAHDFNNILTAVLGNADLLNEMLASDHPGRPLLNQIQAAADRAAALTKQLLAFGRKQIVSPATLNLNQVVSEMRQMLLVMMTEHIQLDLNLDPGVAAIRADRSQIEQIVLNLALNSRDAIAESGTVRISTLNVDVDEDYSEKHPAIPVGRYVAIRVQDNGAGMDQETQAHIFEPFFTTKPKGAGVGLGLATVHNIVSQNNGFISAYSEWGVGTTFTVYLPRMDAPEQTQEQTQPAPDNRIVTETILLVEDEHPVRMLVRRFLETRGYRVLEAPTGPDALRVSREHPGPIHLMITDVVMPRMSGREVAYQLAPERPDMKVLYMSGHTEDAILHHGILDQGLAFLQKPFTQEALLASVQSVLDGSQQREEKKG